MTNRLIEIRTRDATDFCEQIEEAIEAGDRFLIELYCRSRELAKNRIRTNVNQDCATTYDDRGCEYLIWAMALVTMGWVVEILRRKARDGHCHTHKEADPEKKPCPIGRQFHERMRQDCIESFETLLTILKGRNLDDRD